MSRDRHEAEKVSPVEYDGLRLLIDFSVADLKKRSAGRSVYERFDVAKRRVGDGPTNENRRREVVLIQGPSLFTQPPAAGHPVEPAAAMSYCSCPSVSVVSVLEL
jgi:hypothetical protein